MTFSKHNPSVNGEVNSYVYIFNNSLVEDVRLKILSVSCGEDVRVDVHLWPPTGRRRNDPDQTAASYWRIAVV